MTMTECKLHFLCEQARTDFVRDGAREARLKKLPASGRRMGRMLADWEYNENPKGGGRGEVRQVERTALVLGAGMVGVSVALHLRRRGWDVVLVDRQGPGEGASFGNGGLIQREAVYPHPFPRALAELRRIARNRAVTWFIIHRRCPAFPCLCCDTGGIRRRSAMRVRCSATPV
jgi:hypothetical protein